MCTATDVQMRFYVRFAVWGKFALFLLPKTRDKDFRGSSMSAPCDSAGLPSLTPYPLYYHSVGVSCL